MELLIFGTLIVALLVCGYIIRNLMKKVEVLEDNIDELSKEIENYDTFFDDVKKHANASIDRMKQIDRLGSFEADDETGFIFKELYEIVELLSKRFD
jgi:cell division protein FtsL